MAYIPYPVNKTHRQVLEGLVLSPEVYVGKVVASEGATCPLTGAYLRQGERSWWVRDLGSFKVCPTDEQIRELARRKLAELDALGIQ